MKGKHISLRFHIVRTLWPCIVARCLKKNPFKLILWGYLLKNIPLTKPQSHLNTFLGGWPQAHVAWGWPHMFFFQFLGNPLVRGEVMKWVNHNNYVVFHASSNWDNNYFIQSSVFRKSNWATLLRVTVQKGMYQPADFHFINTYLNNNKETTSRTLYFFYYYSWQRSRAVVVIALCVDTSTLLLSNSRL